MEHFLLSLNTILPLFLIMITGYLSRHFGIISRELIAPFNRIAFRIFIPCLLFYNVYTSRLDGLIRPQLLLFGVGGVLMVLLVVLTIVCRVEKDCSKRGVLVQAIFRSNYVIMGLALAKSLSNSPEIGMVAIMIAVIIPLYNVLSVIILETLRGERTDLRTILRQIAQNPLVIGSVLGIIALLLHLQLPTAVESAIGSIGNIGTALQVFLLGAFFHFDGLKRYKSILIMVVFFRLVLVPGVMLSIAAILGFRGLEFISLLGLFASPTAINSFTMVQQMNCGHEELAGDIVVLTSACSIFTMFGWIWLFKSLGFF